MPAKSKAQQRFFGMVHALQKGDAKPSDYSKEVQKVAKDMPKKAAKDYASTDTKNLPDKKEEIELLIRREIKDILTKKDVMKKSELRQIIREEIKKLKESLDHNDVMRIVDAAAQYSDNAHIAADQEWRSGKSLIDYLVSDHIPKKYQQKFKNDVKQFYK